MNNVTTEEGRRRTKHNDDDDVYDGRKVHGSILTPSSQQIYRILDIIQQCTIQLVDDCIEGKE